MPVKRRRDKRKLIYPPVIEALIAGETIEPTDENRSAILGVVYFNEFPELPKSAQDRARAFLLDCRDVPRLPK